MNGIDGLLLVGHYDSRDDVESKAPRKQDCVAHTDNANYVWNGKEWMILTMNQYIRFKVVSRAHITGRGYVTVIHNPDLLPIDCKKSAICKGQFRLPIHGIERMMTLMTIPKVKPYWGLITSEETVGDEIAVRMYPDKEDEPVELNLNDPKS